MTDVGSVADVTQPPTRLPRAVRAAAGRISWGLADQAVSSLTNFAVGVVVARSLGPAEFGAFSLAWVTYAVVLNLSRGLGTDPLTVRYSGSADARWRFAVRQATSTVLLVGLTTGLGCVAAGLLLGGSVGPALLGLGLVLPLLLVQDGWRYAFFAAGRGRSAFLNDLVWALALVPAIAVASRHPGEFEFVVAWGAAGGVAAALGCLQVRLVPLGLRRAVDWIRQQRDLGWRYMIENVAVSSASQLRMYGLGAISGLAAVGAVRGAQLLLGPFLAVLMGVSLVAVPEAARVLRRSPRRLPLFCIGLGGVQAFAALLWGLALLLLMPAAVGAGLLGSVWPLAAALIIPTTLVAVHGSLSDGAFVGLRAMGAAPRSLRAQLVIAAAYVLFGLAGAAVSGAAGSAWGVAAATLIGACVAWWQLGAALRDLPAPVRSLDTQLTEERQA
jgi:O-antigen/teichoic acid export membrane protein